ncbi:MAG: POT family MFS transporter [Planctomycetaceae bacterium]|nr:POT family MFS transporter [Planctomycetaceae bacterium]
MAAAEYRRVPEEIEGLPKGIKYIIGNEAAERFSFYGMRTILVVFMTKYLHWMLEGTVGTAMSKAEANEHYHSFIAATYFFPVLGSILSDVFIGKYRTILSLSIVYCLGHLSLALMGAPGLSPGMWLFVGLALIAFGSGGIKPCVSAHVGDQFGRKNSHLMTRVFQWFYFAINFGSTASTVMTPWLLEWYGPHIAFGVPGVLMALATLLFWMGRHVFIHVPAGGMNFIRETFSREGVNALLKLMLIYAFVAVFWGMFDQTGSSWVIQAENMNRWFLGVEWLESQIQVVNPILVMILIPLFQFVVYPAVDKVFLLTPIRKISIGFFLTAGSFALVALAQELIDKGHTPSIAWQLWSYVLLTAGEVMISITGLEFSYTQAPKTMKSVIMAVWLFSVSLGNIFTSYINHSIQTPGVSEIAAGVDGLKVDSEASVGEWKVRTTSRTIEGAERPGKTVQVAGLDGNFDTADDVVLQFDDYMKLTGVETPDNAALQDAADLIVQHYLKSGSSDVDRSLPSLEQAQALLQGKTDSYGNALQYKLLSRDHYRITSSGADRQPQTRWDLIVSGHVSRVAPIGDAVSGGATEYTWLEQQMISTLGEEGRAMVEQARGEIPETRFDADITVGGQDTLEGADYFWFWTRTIFYTAVLFVPVGYFYKEKSYIQDESEESEDPTAAADAENPATTD